MRSGFSLILAVFFVLFSGLARAEDEKDFAAQTKDLSARTGFIDLYVDEEKAKILAALPAPGEDGVLARFIYSAGLTGGLGSNPVGLDRSRAGSGTILRFRKIGPKVVAEEENWRYRATADRPLEKRAVAQSFATSFLWSTDIAATAEDGRVLIDLSKFLTRDQNDLAGSLKHGGDSGAYALAKDRSFPDAKSVLVFPDNVELDAFVTFTTAKTNAQTDAVTPDARSVTLGLHHSFVRLPDDGYETRKFDQRTANIGMGYYDYSAPLDAPIMTQLSRRHRLQRVNPNVASGPVKEPIVYYVDSGAPAEIRDALIEGASWWKQGFEAAGFEDAYRVEVLPEGAHPLDVRYNVINWVHRQTRGWSYGASVSDPRTGEILKANVILGSQRVRQDRMIFEGLAGVSKTGTGAADDPVKISLARIRQLSAHEVGHTLGFAHNFAASTNDRASVMDYPAPYVLPKADGGLDFSKAYGVGLGAWDVFTVKWLYTQFAEGVDEDAALEEMVSEAHGAGLRFVADQHGRSVGAAHPYGSVWDNGADAIAALDETMRVRQIALADFGLDRLAEGRATSDLNAVIVPIYLYHRYQVAAAAKSIGGLEFGYAVNGDGGAPARLVSPDAQRRALDALLRTLSPEALDLPDDLLNLLTPGDVGYAGLAPPVETFDNRTGPVFDLASAADTAAELTLSAIFHPARIERLLAYEMRLDDALTVSELVERTSDVVFASPETERQQALAQVVQARYIQTLIDLSRSKNASFAATTAIDTELAAMSEQFKSRRAARTALGRAFLKSLAALIDRHLDGEDMPASSAPDIPPGSPIGAGEYGEACWHCESVAGR